MKNLLCIPLLFLSLLAFGQNLPSRFETGDVPSQVDFQAMIDSIRVGYEKTWAEIQNKPSTFTPSGHTHPLSSITDAGTLAGQNTITESQISDFGSYETAFSKNTGFNKNFGTTAGTVAQGNDSRFTDTRTPTDNSVTSAKIVNGAVTGPDIADDAINQYKIADGEVLETKLETAVQNKINGAVQGATAGITIWVGTIDAHAALGTYDDNTLYFKLANP